MRAARRGAPAAPPRARWRAALPALGCALAAALAYGPTLGYGLVWDDHRLIERNPLLRSAGGVARLMTADFWQISGTPSGYWRPLTTLSYALDGWLWRWAPAGFHLTNLLAHAAATALLVWLALEAGLPRIAAVLAGLWFAFLPAHEQSVAWISGRTDVLCGLFALLALLLDRRDRHAGRARPGALALVAFALALLPKEAAVLLVAVIAVADAVEGEPARPLGDRIRWLVPYLAITLVYGLLHRLLVHDAPLPAYVDAALQQRGRWTAWAMLPRDLALLLPWAPASAGLLALAEHPGAPQVIAGVGLAVALVVALVLLVRRRSALAPPLALFVATVAPTLAAALVLSFLVFDQRLLYLPSAGAAWLLAAAIGRARPAALRATLIGLTAIAAVWGLVVLERRLPAWVDDATLFGSMSRAQPRNATARGLYAAELIHRGREAEALAQLAVADSLDPRCPGAHYARALIAFRHGDWPRVLDQARRMRALDPADLQSRQLESVALLRMGRLGEAEAVLEALRGAAASDPNVESSWGEYLLMRGRPAEALPALERAAAYVQDDPDLMFALGMAHARLDQVTQARDAFVAATRLDPGFYDAWLKLATAEHLLGDLPARGAALARAAALPEAADGRAAQLRSRLEAAR